MVRSSCIKYGGDRGSRAGCRRRSVMFFWSFCLFVTLWNYKVCDNGNAMKQQCNFQNNYGTVAQRKISSCTPIFNFFYGPPGFFLNGKFIPEIVNFGDFGSREATFLKPRRWKLAWLWARWRPSSTPNFVKIA